MQVVCRKWYFTHIPKISEPIFILINYAEVDKFLAQPPKHESKEALEMWEKLGPLSIKIFKKNQNIPVVFEKRDTALARWKDKLGASCIGTINKKTGKPQGIVRKIWRGGSVEEYFCQVCRS